MAILAVSQYTAQHATKFHSYGYSSARVTGTVFDIRNGPDVIDQVFELDYTGLLTLGAALPLASGGLGLTTLAAGDIVYASALDTPAGLTVGGANDVLTSNGTVPGWTAGLTNTHIAVGAEIAVSKLADGSARQLLQTDAGGTSVEWATNIDIPGTLDVTGAAVFDTTAIVAGLFTATSTIISGSSSVTLRRNVQNSNIHITGGTSQDDGAAIDLYGSAHGSLAHDIRLRTAGANRAHFDHSNLNWSMTGTMSLTGILTPSAGIELPTTQRLVLDGAAGQDYISSPSANLVRVTVGDVTRADFTSGGFDVTGELTSTGNAGIGVATLSTTFLHLGPATTAKSSIVLPHGTAPTSPNNGDTWTTTAGLFVRINGATVGPLSSSVGDITRVNITAGTGLTGDVDTTSGDHTQTINAIGTANRISVSSGAINIDTGYIGQASITTVGTLVAGGVPASLVTAGSFGSGTFTFDGTVNATTFVGALTGDASGNAGTATILETSRNINGVAFNGSANITVTAAAGTLTGGTLNATVTASSLTSVGTIASLRTTEASAGVAPSSSTFLNLAAGTTARSSVRAAHGVAPTAPVNGDIWTTSAEGLFVRVNGVTVGPLGSSGTGDITNVNITAGIGLDGSVNTADGAHVQTLDFLPSGLTALASGLVGADELVVSDAGVAKRALVSGINLGIFNNDQNWSATVGTVTSVIAGAGMTQTGTSTINPTLNVIGTASRISVSANAINIDTGYVGQTSITTLGTIGTGTWQGSVISTTYTAAKVTGVTGGSGINSTEGTAPDISLNVNELAVGGTLVAGDWLIASNATVSNRQLISAIPLGIFSNDQGWTANAGTVTTVTAGVGLSGGGSPSPTITLDLSELSLGGTPIAGDHVAYVDGGLTRKIAFSSINLSIMTNNLGWTTNTGTVTSVATGAGLDGSFSTSGTITIDFEELSASGTLTGTDDLVTIDGGLSRKTQINTINLGNFINNLGWTTAVGDITNVTAGAGMTGGGASGSVTLNCIGTSNRILVNADNIDIHSSYVGQTSITTLGTITTGSIPAARVNSGTLAVARIPDLNASKIDAGTFGSGTYTFPSNLIINGQVYSPQQTTGSSTIDWNAGNSVHLDNSGTRTIVLNNGVNGGTYIISIQRQTSAASDWTWPTIQWVAGAEPVLSTAAGSWDLIYLMRADGVWIGNYSLGHT